MQRHSGVVCPDGKVMCCHCFERISQDDLWTDPEDGRKVDVCKPCKTREDEMMRRRQEQPK